MKVVVIICDPKKYERHGQAKVFGCGRTWELYSRGGVFCCPDCGLQRTITQV
jgi:predicted RNA-binding Zn-ribbon protein involved in translation (DUF1610 family)